MPVYEFLVCTDTKAEHDRPNSGNVISYREPGGDWGKKVYANPCNRIVRLEISEEQAEELLLTEAAKWRQDMSVKDDTFFERRKGETGKEYNIRTKQDDFLHGKFRAKTLDLDHIDLTTKEKDFFTDISKKTEVLVLDSRKSTIIVDETDLTLVVP